MYAPLFATAAASPDVVALLGSSPIRIYPFGEAPDKVARPYVVWQTVGGAPENFLDRRPDIDRFSTQIDVYAETATAARAVAKAMINAIEPVAYVTGYNGETRDTETKDYRYSFDVDWLTKR